MSDETPYLTVAVTFRVPLPAGTDEESAGWIGLEWQSRFNQDPIGALTALASFPDPKRDGQTAQWPTQVKVTLGDEA